MRAPADPAAPADRNASAALDVPAAAQSPNSAGKGLRNNRIDVATLRGRPRGVLHPADLQLPDGEGRSHVTDRLSSCCTARKGLGRHVALPSLAPILGRRFLGAALPARGDRSSLEQDLPNASDGLEHRMSLAWRLPGMAALRSPDFPRTAERFTVASKSRLQAWQATVRSSAQ